MARAFDIGVASLPGNGYPPLLAFQTPVTDGLNGLFLFGEGMELLSKNWVSGGEDALVVGAPIPHTGYVTFTGSKDYLQTDIAETVEQTIIFIGKEVSNAQVPWVGSWGSKGVGLYTGTNASTMNSATTRQDVSGNAGTTVVSNTAAWGLYALTVPQTGQTQLNNLTGGTVGQGPSGTRVVSGSGPYRIGSFYNPLFNGECDMMLALIYNRALSTTELNAVAGWAKLYADIYGITV